MEIIGYSERGAMNALFYGIALKKDNEAMKKFLALALRKNKNDIKFCDFNLYMEFSLTEFGSPDLVIIAIKSNGEKTAFFIEAKASCCNNYDLTKQKKQHEEYINEGKNVDGHASNLFFQLRLKNYFFQQNRHSIADTIPNEIRNSRGRERKIGDNPIVRKFASEFGDCKEAYYIAIIPEQKETFDKPDSSYDGFDIYYVSWKELYDSFNNYGFLDKVILYNQINEVDAPKAKSQILNNI